MGAPHGVTKLSILILRIFLKYELSSLCLAEWSLKKTSVAQMGASTASTSSHALFWKQVAGYIPKNLVRLSM